MELLFLGNLISKTFIKEFEKSVDMLDCGTSILDTMRLGLVIAILKKPVAVVIQHAVGCADTNCFPVERDGRVVSNDSSKRIDEMLRVDNHERSISYRRSSRINILLFIGIIAVTSVIDIFKGSRQGPIYLRGCSTRMNHASVIIRSALNAHGGDNLENRLLDKLAVLVSLMLSDFVGGHVLERLRASQACRMKLDNNESFI